MTFRTLRIIAVVVAVVAAIVSGVAGSIALAVAFGAIAVAWISIPTPRSESAEATIRFAALASIVATLIAIVLVALS